LTTGTQKDYAAHIKASEPYVSKLARQNRLVFVMEDGRRLVDFEASDRLIRNTTDLVNANAGANAKPGRPPSTPLLPIADAGRVDVIFRQAQTQERVFGAKTAELSYKKAIGEVVNVAEVEASLQRRASTYREAMLQIAGRISAQVAAETDQAKCHTLIDTEIRGAMAHLTAQ